MDGVFIQLGTAMVSLRFPPTMFHERADGHAVKRAFKEQFGIDKTPTTKGLNSGDLTSSTTTWTQLSARLRLPHRIGQRPRIDFVKPAQQSTPTPPRSRALHPERHHLPHHPGLADRGRPGNAHCQSPRQGVRMGTVARFESDRKPIMHHCEWQGRPAEFKARWAETMVGDLNFELIQPLGPGNPGRRSWNTTWQGISVDCLDVRDPRGVGTGQGPVRQGTASASPPWATSATTSKRASSSAPSALQVRHRVGQLGPMPDHFMEPTATYPSLRRPGSPRTGAGPSVPVHDHVPQRHASTVPADLGGRDGPCAQARQTC